jgi:sec-independent protein translocase protein TatC
VSAKPLEQDLSDGRMTIWEHLAELRVRIIKSMIAVGLGMVVGWIVYPQVLDFLLQPYRDIEPDKDLVAFSPVEFFTVRMQVAAYIGIALAMPVLLWQVWRFVTPGLYPHEKKYAIPFIASSLVLFAGGATLAYIALTPALEFLLGLGGDNVTDLFSQQEYLSFTTWMMLAFGAAFEVPVLLVALQLIGVLSPRQLLGFWRYAIVIIAVVAAVITPSGDPITMAALVIPMTLLYFGAIAIGALVGWRKGKRQQRTDTPSGT